jgi:cytochrome P450
VLIVAFALHIIVLCIAGHTNQSTTTVWTLLHALRSPLLERLRQATSNDLLDATFRESGRLYTNLMLLRRITISQEILGKQIPKGTYIACSPVVTARDPDVYPDPEKFRPERWLTDSGELDETRIKHLHRIGASSQFGKGQHACVGERLGRFMVMDLLWGIILGNDKEPGFEVEIVSGIIEGVGIDNVGVEAAWAEENLGTPSEKGGPVLLRFSRRGV